MKKLLLFTVLFTISFCANAQQAKKAIESYHIRDTEFNLSAKSTISGGRWYNHAAMVNDYLTNQLMTDHLFPIWYDSTVLQNYSTGLAPIEYISAAQIVDPIHFILWNDPNVSDPFTIAICDDTPYKVDSISFLGAYIKNPNRPVNVVDTLILSVSPTSANSPDLYKYYSTSAFYDPWVSDYISITGLDTILKGFTIDSLDVDVANRASNVGGRIIWKVPLTDTDRQVVSGDSIDVVNFKYPVMVNSLPGVCDIPAGHGVAVTVTFKSGDIVMTNVDTFSEYHHLLLWSGEGMGDSTTMHYFFYSNRDRNMSNLMFSSDDSVYHPSIFVEGNSDSSFGYEFHGISAHVACDDCDEVYYACGQGGYTPNITKATALIYPNPANEFLSISFAQAQNENVYISLINAIGHVVANRDIDKTVVNQTNKVTLATTDLPEGIYFYIIRSNGQQTTGRFTILH